MKYSSIFLPICASSVFLFPYYFAWGEVGEENVAIPPYVVEAEVVSSHKLPAGSIDVELQITHVFWGDKAIASKTFRVECPNITTGSFAGTTGNLYPPLKEKETSIWALKIDKDKLIADFSRYELSLPSRKGIARDYQGVRKYAETIEQYANTPEKSRRDFLKEKAASETFEVSNWAIRTLGASGEKDDLAFLQTLSEGDKSTPLALTTLDDVLARKVPTWKKSQERGRILNSLMTREYSDEALANRIEGKLCMEMQLGTLDAGQLLDLMKLAFANDKMPRESRRNACRSIGFLANRCKDTIGNCFDFFLQLTENEDTQYAEEAAQLIQYRIPLDKNRKERILQTLPKMNAKAAAVLTPLVKEAGVTKRVTKRCQLQKGARSYKKVPGTIYFDSLVELQKGTRNHLFRFLG
jgi:hypothetical protein